MSAKPVTWLNTSFMTKPDAPPKRRKPPVWVEAIMVMALIVMGYVLVALVLTL